MLKQQINNSNLILNIPVKINKTVGKNSIFEQNFFDYDPNIIEPKPFTKDDNYCTLETFNNNISTDIDIIKSQSSNYNIEASNESEKIFVNCKEFEKGIPNSTSIHCFWCCHQFDNKPCVLPISLNNKKFKVIGCFCSPECASAYNFNNFSHNCWEHNALLNLLYKITYKNNSIKIKPSPSREVLSIFGGKLSIDEFRSSSNYVKDHLVIYPPLVTSLSNHEEKSSGKIKLNDLKIKRSIPLKSKNTLDKFVISN
tara:strand:- start:355 stop:1119 length:765 start_codon:yes stop_codon:yes gene_type:complete